MGNFKKKWESALDKKNYKESQTGNFPHSVNDPNVSHYLKTEVYTDGEVDSLLAGKEDSFGAGQTTEYLSGDKTWVTLNTSVVPESGSNWYYTNARFEVDWALKTTNELPEGGGGDPNLYFTTPRARAAISGTNPIDYTVSTGVIAFLHNSTNLKITSNELNTIQNIHSAASPSFAQIQLTGGGNNTIAGNILFSGNKSYSHSFNSGWAGSGFRIDYGVTATNQATFEMDTLWVRGSMYVYELVINQIRATNGSLFVSSAAKVKSVDDPGIQYDVEVYFEQPDGDYIPFAVGDIILMQNVDLDGTTILRKVAIEIEATSSGGLIGGIYVYQGGGTDQPQPGDVFARIGNEGAFPNRQGVVYLTSDDSASPYIDIVDGVASYEDWGTPEKTKARLGLLTGIESSSFGPLTGYGLYTQNVYLEGDAHIRGTITAGDADGYGNTFYAGRINMNTFYKSQDADWGDTDSPIDYWTNGSATVSQSNILLPNGLSSGLTNLIVSISGSVIPYIDFDSNGINAGDIKGRTFTFSFWAKAGSTAVGTLVAKWNWPINTQIESDMDFIVGTDWERYTYTIEVPDTGGGANTLRWLFSQPNNGNGHGIYFWGFQFEEHSHASAYQVTDGSIVTTDSYGMWAIKGGFGGTVQNPRIALAEEGIVVRSDGSSLLWGGNDTVSIGFNGSIWGIIGREGAVKVFELGSTNQIAGWTFDSAKFTKGIATAGISLNTSSTPFITGASAVGFEVYDSADPKMFIGKKDGSFLDYNVTTADTLTIEGEIVSSKFSTTSSFGTYTVGVIIQAGLVDVFKDNDGGFNYKVNLTGKGCAFRYSTDTSFNNISIDLFASRTGPYIEIDTLNLGKYHGSASSAPSTNVRDGDTYYNTGDGLVYMYANAAWRQIS